MNIAEILKNAPEGTKLYSPMFGECEFVGTDFSSNYCIAVKHHDDHIEQLTADGKYYIDQDAECILFPSKQNRDWNTFKFIKPGDVIKAGNVFYIMKTEKIHLIAYDATHDIIYSNASEQPINHEIIKQVKIATQEEKNTLFKLIEKHGIKYNPIDISFEKVKIEQKYSFKPFDKVLVRDTDDGQWKCNIYSHKESDNVFPYKCIYGRYKQCIPFEGYEDLVGTTTSPDSIYPA